MKFLKEEALKVICQRTGDDYYDVADIQWVLTVPAIKAKQFMREAAYEEAHLTSLCTQYRVKVLSKRYTR